MTSRKRCGAWKGKRHAHDAGAGDAPADWRAQAGRWDRLHHGQVALLVAAFVLVAVGLLAA